MRVYIFVLFLLISIFLPPVNVSAFSLVIPDSIIAKNLNAQVNKQFGFHLVLTYGRAVFSTRAGVVSAYYASGYPYHVVSLADPTAKAGQPMLLAASLEKNITKRIYIGAQYSITRNQKITGSNWLGADDDVPVPVEQFDVKESYSSKFLNFTAHYVIVPINFLYSRWEITAGAGLSYNRMKLNGVQNYVRRPNNYTAYDDTSAFYSAGKKGLGYVVNGSMDFYWSPFVSTQFKLEFRNTPSLIVPEQRMTYLTTRSRVRLSDTRVLKKHSIRYSGTVLSVSLRFHI